MLDESRVKQQLESQRRQVVMEEECVIDEKVRQKVANVAEK
jgi:hypothetical protein